MTAIGTDELFELEIEHLSSHATLSVRVHGAVTFDDLLSIAAPVHAHPAFGQVRGVLYDMRDARQVFDTSELRAFADQLAERQEPEGYRVAYLVESDLAFGMARMFESLAEGVHDRERGVFRDAEEALAWLSG